MTNNEPVVCHLRKVYHPFAGVMHICTACSRYPTSNITAVVYDDCGGAGRKRVNTMIYYCTAETLKNR